MLGIWLRGMSMTVVTPPAAAALDPKSAPATETASKTESAEMEWLNFLVHGKACIAGMLSSSLIGGDLLQDLSSKEYKMPKGV